MKNKNEELKVGDRLTIKKPTATVEAGLVVGVNEDNGEVDVTLLPYGGVLRMDPKILLERFDLVQDPEKFMWEILVPTVRPNTEGNQFFKTKYHKVWDEKVRNLTGGLTILGPSKGQWVSPEGMLFDERMIPVRILATEDEISQIIDMTMDYYGQQAVMCYMISNKVILRHKKDRVNQS